MFVDILNSTFVYTVDGGAGFSFTIHLNDSHLVVPTRISTRPKPVDPLG